MKILYLSALFLCSTIVATAQDEVMKVSARISGGRFTAVVKDRYDLSIINSKHKVVFTLSNKTGSISNITFKDFDGDGNKDLLIDYLTNVPGIYDLLLYNKQSGRFIQVRDFDRYPAPIRIPHTSFYYSYHRSGCADMDWDSDLFRIINFKVVRLGNISVRTCSGDELPGLFVYKVQGSKKIFIKNFLQSKPDQYMPDKWIFIRSYWKRHYRRFKD